MHTVTLAHLDKWAQVMKVLLIGWDKHRRGNLEPQVGLPWGQDQESLTISSEKASSSPQIKGRYIPLKTFHLLTFSSNLISPTSDEQVDLEFGRVPASFSILFHLLPSRPLLCDSGQVTSSVWNLGSACMRWSRGNTFRVVRLMF